MRAQLVYDCYRYDTDDPATRTRHGRLIPPADNACLWHGESHRPFLKTSCHDAAAALAWIEQEITTVVTELQSQDAWPLPVPLRLTRAAADALAGVHTAWQWQQTLHRDRLVIVAVRGYQPTDSRPAAADQAPRTGRRFLP